METGFFMKKFFSIVIICIMFTQLKSSVYAEDIELYAKAAVLIDGDNNRILYGKNENEVLPMASTTKIMTLYIATQYGNMEDIVTFSKYAAGQPDVQLNAKKGEQYTLLDMCYIMMLKSYNDVAVAIAECVGEKILGKSGTAFSDRRADESKIYVKAFVDKMNEAAKNMGLTNTYFITVNGLDANDGKRIHSTTAYELAQIAACAIDVDIINKICTTREYRCSEKNGKRTVYVANANKFLDMVNGAVGMKTGFTGEAGYCFVGVVMQDGRKFVSVVLGCGWPPHKSYKWQDTKKLMNYGIKNYFPQDVVVEDRNLRKIFVKNGVSNYTEAEITENIRLLLNDEEIINVVYELPDSINAPVEKGDKIGKAYVYIDGDIYITFPIRCKTTVNIKNYMWYLFKFIKVIMLKN